MHEFIPALRKSFISKAKVLKSDAINIKTRALGSQPIVQPIARADAKVSSLGRVIPGPRLRPSRSAPNNEYLLIFDDNLNDGIKSVGRIWKGSNLRTDNKMKCWVQFLSTPTADTPGTTLLLHFDAKRYLIGNVAEGTQRAVVQRKLGLTKVSDIFLTGKSGWKTMGGILGMILTLADQTATRREELQRQLKSNNANGVEQVRPFLNIHGGKNLTHILATARRFIFRKGLPIHTQEFKVEKDKLVEDLEPTWKDDCIKVWAMVLEPEGRTTSPKKRSHEEFTGDISGLLSNRTQKANAEEENMNDQMRKGVVASMFDSDWRMDTLVSKKLSEVAGPATIFFRNEQGRIVKYEGPKAGEGKDIPDIDVLVRNPWPGALVETLPSTTPTNNAVSYIIKNYPQRGKFDAKAAIKLGVTPGRDFGSLTKGISVTTKDGATVTPEQVLGGGKEGGGFAVIELPERTYVEAMIGRKEWSSKQIMDGIGVVIWLLGPGVVEDPRLQNFMKEHHELKHIVSSVETSSNYIALESAAAAAIRLHLLDPERFPIPVHNNTTAFQKSNKSNNPLFEKARVGKTILLEPRIEIQDDQIIHYLDTAKVVSETPEEVQTLSDEARKEITSQEYLAKLAEHQQDIPSKDAEVFTLGTGSALPSKYRNVSATLLRVPGYGTYLFDCGENTLGQLKRVLGDDLPDVLRDLKAIWISHLHADHHLGTASVIQEWHQETKSNEMTKNNKLIVASDEGMIKWLREYSDVEPGGYDRLEPVVLGGPLKNFHQRFDQAKAQTIGLTSIQACRVDHCHGAMAVVFNFPNGFKVAYSGDCRPSSDFARIGKGATLLIHEATFDDELQGDAFAKKHSTTSEAIGVGKAMNARRILLTHFSQRYQKIPVMDSRDGKDQVVIVAFDYMRVKIGDIAKLEAFKPALTKLYEDKED